MAILVTKRGIGIDGHFGDQAWYRGALHCGWLHSSPPCIRLVFINVVHSLEDEVAIALFNGVTEVQSVFM